MQGWIKISRNISYHWLWQDAERLRWWLDLLIMASWEDKEVIHDSHLFTLRRGQMIASVAFLSKRWKRNRQTIIRYLTLIENEDMIKREVLYRQTSIITICNYDIYQLQTAEQVDTIVDGQVGTIVDTIVDTNKEFKEYIYTTSSLDARAREEKFIEEMKNDRYWCELIAMRFYLKSIEPILGWLDKFKLDLQCRDVTHQNLGDAKRHFNDWLRIQLQNKNRDENSEIRRPNKFQTATKQQRDEEFADHIAKKLASDDLH